MPRIVISILLLLATASPAFAQDGPTAELARRAPSAIFVDGVKVGDDVQLPKQATLQTSRCTSGCTIMITN